MSLRKIHVVSTPVIKSGTGRNGSTYTLREVIATDPEGAPIQEKLKTFDDGITSGPVEVEVERQDDPQWGPSYLLRLPRQGGGGGSPGARLGPKVDELRDRLERVEQQIQHLLTEVGGLVAEAHSRGSTAPTPPPANELALTGEPATQAPPPRNATFDDDDIPF